MYYEFYLDMYFLENLVINGAVLWMTGVLGNERCKKGRLLGAAALGAVGSCLAVVMHWFRSPLQELLLNTLVELGMLAGVYGRGSLTQWMVRGAVFRLLSLLAEGSWQLLRRFLQVPIPVSMAAGIFLPFFLVGQVWKRRNHSQFLYPVTIFRQGRQQTLTALWDSGNQLTQPVTGRPVHIIDYESIRRLLTESEQEELEKLLDLQPVENPTGTFTLIPYRTIGKNQGLLPALRLDEIRIEKEGGARETPNRLAAVSKTSVSHTGAYQMILHP